MRFGSKDIIRLVWVHYPPHTFYLHVDMHAKLYFANPMLAFVRWFVEIPNLLGFLMGTYTRFV